MEGSVRDPLRERLLDAAARVFAQKGYDGTRILDVVAEAGLSTGAVYGRFGSKNDLLREAVSSRSASRASGEVDRASKVADLLLRGALRSDPLAQLGEMLRQPRIPDGPCDALGQGILCRPQVGGRLLQLPQLLIGSGAVPEGYRPLQTVGLDGACRQERDPAVKNIQCLFWLVRNRQQGNAIFVVGHDTRHTLGGGAAFGFIDLRLASRNGFCVLRLQQRRAGRAGSLCGRKARQKSDAREKCSRFAK